MPDWTKGSNPSSNFLAPVALRANFLTLGNVHGSATTHKSCSPVKARLIDGVQSGIGKARHFQLVGLTNNLTTGICSAGSRTRVVSRVRAGGIQPEGKHGCQVGIHLRRLVTMHMCQSLIGCSMHASPLQSCAHGYILNGPWCPMPGRSTCRKMQGPPIGLDQIHFLQEILRTPCVSTGQAAAQVFSSGTKKWLTVGRGL